MTNHPKSTDDKLAALWLADAQKRPVNQQAWAIFIAQLRMAAHRERNGRCDPRLPDGLTSVKALVVAVHDFLSAHDFAVDEKLPALSVRLMMSIGDVAEGRPTPLFKPTFVGPSRKRVVEANVSAIAARALTELVSGGTALQEGAAIVSRAARAGKVAGYTRCTADRVQNWRARLEEGEGAVTPEALLRYKAPLPQEAGQTHQNKAAWLLKMLKDSPALRYG